MILVKGADWFALVLKLALFTSKDFYANIYGRVY